MRKLFPFEWYLPKGIKYALDEELENASSACESWGIWCGALVVLSVLAELIIAWVSPPYQLFLSLSVWPDAAIGIGIVGEVLFGMRDSRIQTELRSRSNAKLGEAKKIAAQATKEAADARERTAAIEKLTAWRRVSPEQYSSIIAKIRAFSSDIDLLVEYEYGDPEAATYARELAWIFQQAGVSRIRGNANSILAPGMFGVRMAGASEIDGLAIIEAFVSAGIKLTIDTMDLSHHLPSNERAPNLYFFVAPKTPPGWGEPLTPMRESSI